MAFIGDIIYNLIVRIMPSFNKKSLLRLFSVCGFFAMILLTACAMGIRSEGTSAAAETTGQILETAEETQLPTHTRTSSSTAILTVPESTSNPTLTEAPDVVEINSPLAGKSLEELTAMISNPFHPPAPGSDDPHQGVDFSDVLEGSQTAIAGREVFALINGQVVANMQNRFPYGNAVLIETNLQEAPEGWRAFIETLEIPVSWEASSPLTCPAGWNDPPESRDGLSLYILYAHLQNPVLQEEGERVVSGEKIGAIGMSGNALAPHLHIETRYGYTGDFSGSMAHYDVSASLQEMSNYCRWRVSGWYALIDPMTLLSMH
jgi:murein DD-endopeptidase MepM/ murein hydrolase activator NlpD